MILDFYQNVLGQEGYTTEASEIFTKAVDNLPALNVVTPRLGDFKRFLQNFAHTSVSAS